MSRANENARLQPGVGKAKHYAVKDTPLRGIRQHTQRIIVSPLLTIIAAAILLFLHLAMQ